MWKAGPVLCRVSLDWMLSDVFLMLKLQLWVLGKKFTEMKCDSYHIITRLHTLNITCHHWCWPGSPALKDCFSNSPLWTYSFPASLSTLCSLEKSYHAQFTFKEWELCLIFLVWKSYINYFCKGMFFCSLPFIYSIINQINIYFILWVESPILPYFLAPIVPGWALGRSFHQFLCSLDAFPLLWRLLYLLVCF